MTCRTEDNAPEPSESLPWGAEDELHRLLFVKHPHPMWLVDIETRAFLEVNEAAVQHYGYTRAEFLGMTVEDIRPPEDIPHLRALYERLRAESNDAQTGKAGLWRHRKKDGTLIDVAISWFALPVRGKPALLILAHDVTAYRHADEALRASEERFRLLVERTQDYAIFMLDPHGHIVSWNIGAERMKGYRAEEILGEHFSRFYTPDDMACGRPTYALSVAMRAGRFEDEGYRVRKDGSRFIANVLITALYDNGDTSRLCQDHPRYYRAQEGRRGSQAPSRDP
jgi:PAS domain S-box-containing protein